MRKRDYVVITGVLALGTVVFSYVMRQVKYRRKKKRIETAVRQVC